MLIRLIKKEFALCLHPTSLIFLLFAAFVFIPNYPYEVMFFFSGLSVFFICITSRENGDLAFTCNLPVRKSDVAAARILFCVILQAALLCLAAVFTVIKQLAFPLEQQINMAGMMANTAFLGFGAMLLGAFNVIYFPLYFRKPQSVGVPFLLASTALFVLIAFLIALRFSVPLFMEVLNTTDPLNMPAKLSVLISGLAVYGVLTALAVFMSVKNFDKVDL